MAGLGNGGGRFDGLVAGRPQRRAKVHRRKLAVGALMHVRLAGLLVFLGEPRIEGAAEVDITGVPAGRNDDALGGANVHRIAAVDGGDAEHAAGIVLLAHDRRHLVLEEDLHAFLACAFFQTAHQAGAVAATPRCDDLARDVPFLGDEDAVDRRGVGRADRLLDELDAVVDQEVVSCDVLVGEHANQIAVAQLAFGVVVAHPIQKNLVGRVLDAELLLQSMAAANLHTATAEHAAAADVVVLLDDDNRGTIVACGNGCGQASDAGADDDHVHRVVPPDAAIGLRAGFTRSCAGHSDGTNSCRAP